MQNEPAAITTILKNGDSMTFVGQDTKSLSKKVNPISCKQIFSTAVKQLQNQLASIEQALDTRKVFLVRDVSNFARFHRSKLKETTDVQQMSKQSELVNTIETNVVQKTHNIHEWLNQHNEQKLTRSPQRIN